ncbi:MAG: D-hexose-6-phosphate mutarotase [Campylobacterales bacterium]|nr:D-hexose-6-phosphate mutarotase [Campylobacterales bacterium]
MKIAIPDVLNINHPLCRATILLQGAQLISWIPSGASDVLWSSDISHYASDKAFRGGIPICWPWFGKVFSPAHGFARLMLWELVNRDDNAHGVDLEFRLTDTPQTRQIWPHSFTLLLQIHLGTTCEILLHIDAPIPTTGALHTYLSTSDITQSTISGLGDSYIDTLQENILITTEESSIQIHSEVDRIYTHPQSENILTTPEKTLHLTHQRHSDVVVWNPWAERSAQIVDMRKNDYHNMVCIETARISKFIIEKDSLGIRLHISERK